MVVAAGLPVQTINRLTLAKSLGIRPQRLDRLNPQPSPRRTEGRHQSDQPHDCGHGQQQWRRARNAETDRSERGISALSPD
jgi:hypothetical protein